MTYVNEEILWRQAVEMGDFEYAAELQAEYGAEVAAETVADEPAVAPKKIGAGTLERLPTE